MLSQDILQYVRAVMDTTEGRMKGSVDILSRPEDFCSDDQAGTPV